MPCLLYTSDPGGILNLVAGFSGQLQEALRISANVRLPEDLGGLRNIVTAGLGGSGISGDVVRELISHEVKVPMTAVRGYDLPAFVSRESLVFISSYSGNTEETLSAYEVARKRGARVICVTSGGRLLEAACLLYTSTEKCRYPLCPHSCVYHRCVSLLARRKHIAASRCGLDVYKRQTL